MAKGTQAWEGDAAPSTSSGEADCDRTQEGTLFCMIFDKAPLTEVFYFHFNFLHEHIAALQSRGNIG